MNFNKLYSESGFIRDLAFKKLFLETPELLTFVYEYCLQLLSLPFDDTINYNLHSNDGNRLPRNTFTMKANQIWFLKIYKQILIEKIPFTSDNMCKLLNFLTWQAPIVLSRPNDNPEKMSDEAYNFVNNYYHNMTVELSDLLGIDLFEKWNVNTNQKVLKK